MAVKSTILTKAGVVTDININLIDSKNSKVVWWTGNVPVPSNFEFGSKLPSVQSSDLNFTFLTAAQIVSAIRNFAKESTRIRRYESGQWAVSCNNYVVYNGIQISALNSSYYVAAVQSVIDSTPGIDNQTQVSATALNNFLSTLQSIATQSESDDYRVAYITYDAVTALATAPATAHVMEAELGDKEKQWLFQVQLLQS